MRYFAVEGEPLYVVAEVVADPAEYVDTEVAARRSGALTQGLRGWDVVTEDELQASNGGRLALAHWRRQDDSQWEARYRRDMDRDDVDDLKMLVQWGDKRAADLARAGFPREEVHRYLKEQATEGAEVIPLPSRSRAAGDYARKGADVAALRPPPPRLTAEEGLKAEEVGILWTAMNLGVARLRMSQHAERDAWNKFSTLAANLLDGVHPIRPTESLGGPSEGP
jgi:hypothetical protein